VKTYKCLVNKDGSHSHQILKSGVTAAEIAILRAVHGNDAVRNVTPCLDLNGEPLHAMRLHQDDNGNDVRSRMNRTALLASLRRTYGEDMVARVVPGINPTIPLTIEDLASVTGDEMEDSLIDEMSDEELEAATAPEGQHGDLNANDGDGGTEIIKRETDAKKTKAA
jgi:hypothetical protein